MSQNTFQSSVRQTPKILKLTCCALFATLICAGAFIKIPVPVVPFTLQFLFTTLAGLLLGANTAPPA